ncbi:hypothetical protein QY211_22875 [Vibrio alginolyticus]|nr:hypothetical protein [Vibrio alginolyticus]
MVNFPFPVTSEEDGVSFTAVPAKVEEERAIVEAAMAYQEKSKCLMV